MSNKTDLHRQKLIECLFHLYDSLTLLYSKDISSEHLKERREKLEHFIKDLSNYIDESK